MPLPPLAANQLQNTGPHLMNANEVHIARKDWTAPEVLIGMPVMWYADAVPNARGIAGFCMGKNRNSDTIIVLLPTENYLAEACRHISDPAVNSHQFDRQEGCWAHTEYYERSIMAIANLEKRVASLERKLSSAAAPRSKAS